jgi:hypothetical protein
LTRARRTCAALLSAAALAAPAGSDPRRHSPRTAMPTVGATEEQARHMAAYLYNL